MKILNIKSLLMKMILAFLVLIIIPLLIVGVISISSSSNLLIGQMESNIVSSTEETSKYFDLMFKTVDNFSIQLNSDKEVGDFLDNKLLLDNSKDSDNRTNIKNKLMNLTGTNNFISTITLIRSDYEVITAGTTTSDFSSSSINVQNLLNSKWYKNITENNNVPVWINNHDIGVEANDNSYCAALAKANKSVLGSDKYDFVLIDLKTEEIVSHLASIKIGANDLTYAITPEGKVISPKGDKEIKDIEKTELIRSVISKSSTKAAGSYDIKFNGKDYIVSYLKSDYSKWTTLTLVPKFELISKSNLLKYKIIFIGLIFAIIAVIIGSLFSLNINNSMKELVSAMCSAEKGDLSFKIKEMRNDEIGMVIKSFNSMITNIKKLIIESKDVANSVNNASMSLSIISDNSINAATLISQSIEEIATITEEQTKEIDNCAEATSCLANTINDVVENTKIMHEASRDVERLTTHGISVISELDNKTYESNKITSEVLKNINDLNGYAGNINKIVEMLKGISKQTALLSLNASIEASRAGEYGKGFSVVADEIRKLAEKSGVSTKDIQKIIEQILNSVNESIKLAEKTEEAMVNQTKIVNEAGELFSKINATTKHLIDDINKIYLLVNDMDLNKNQVVRSIENMSAASEENASSAMEVSNLTQNQLSSIQELVVMGNQLNELSEKLINSMSKFQVQKNQ